MANELDYLATLARSGRLSRRDFLGRAAALGIGASAAGTLATSAFAQVPVRGGVLRAGISGGESTNTLDPALNLSHVMFNFCKQWGEFIVRLDREGGVEMMIAEEMNPSSDGLTWTIKVRSGIEFHNGKTVTAEDVAATIARHADADSQSGALGILRGITDIRVSGNEVICTLDMPNADFPYIMADYHLVVQPNGGHDDPNAGISAGPYRVVDNEPGVIHTGERFENYWQLDRRGFADRVEILVINDTTSRTAALRAGQVHIINQVEPAIIDLVSAVPGVNIEPVDGKGFYPFNMFCNTAPFDNYELRMALKYAVDRKEMLDKILRGYGSVGNDSPINAAYPLFSDDIEQREFDPDKAADHYRRSGHSGPIVLRTAEVAFPGAVDAAALYAQTCAEAGIEIQIQREPDDGYWSDVWNVKPFSLSYWGGRPTQDQMFSTGYISTADWNDTRFFNEKFDQVVFAARAELDQDKRKSLYRDASEIIRDEGGLIVPFFNQTIDAVNGNLVDGYLGHPQGSVMDGYALSECWLKA
ncbi:MAG: ABC transporter substrate-binding protein [Rubellimicrobium sp.]|nr:ABC transporter substrate-binding protein [Rubellimicrobium sp.]